MPAKDIESDCFTGEGQHLHEVLMRRGWGNPPQMDHLVPGSSDWSSACGKFLPGNSTYL